MPDIIQLLPDSIANQIAAGEVVQRPASIVKELLENSVDAGADQIKLVIKQAGKSVVQVIDNGKGMSETDARMSFERHATSKIKKAEDLFSIHTFGFRGEALASIAAVARVELKTHRAEDELGTEIIIEDSRVLRHEPCAHPIGTSILVKNLFFNVPARKNFLKSDQVERRHIMDEFVRVALANPHIHLGLFSDDEELYTLPGGKMFERIVQLFGKNYREMVVPIEESAQFIQINGFIGKPENSRKTRGDQFFFANGRFIKSPYFHHAILSAYEGLIAPDHYPPYFLFFDLDPARIDVNVHPTKTEVKFEDEKSIYAILRSTVRKTLSEYNLTPGLDFDGVNAQIPEFWIRPDAATGATSKTFTQDKTYTAPLKPDLGQSAWKTLYESLSNDNSEEKELNDVAKTALFPMTDTEIQAEKLPFQIQNKYIVSPIKSGLLIVNQRLAHQRILFEQYYTRLSNNSGSSQQKLFPEVTHFSLVDFDLIMELKPELKCLGFDFESFGKNAIIVHGIPPEADLYKQNELFDMLLNNYRNSGDNGVAKSEKIARSLAIGTSIPMSKTLTTDEMKVMIDRLFACEIPNYSPDGRPILITLSVEELDKKFND